MNNKLLGNYGEDLAVRFLINKGYKIIERNFRIRGGEIDVIAQEGGALVYVEVKTRTSHAFGLPEESVSYHKLKFIERASKFYRVSHANLPQLERIDVVSVDLSGKYPDINLFKNAEF